MLPIGAFCNIFDLHQEIIGLENQYLVFSRVAVLDRVYCIFCKLLILSLITKTINKNKTFNLFLTVLLIKMVTHRTLVKSA